MNNISVIAKKTKWRITIYLGIIFIVAAILLFLSQYYLYRTLPYNSDDVAGMYMLKYFSIKNLPLLMPPDTFIFKIPFNIIGDLIFPASRRALFVSAYIANLISLALFIFSTAIIVKIATKKQIKPFLFAICVFAFAFIPSLVFTFSLRGPNNRTIEIGIGMVLIALTVYFWSQKSKIKYPKIAIISAIISIFLGFYFYNDPACILFIGIPILIVGLYDYYITRQKKFLFPPFIVLFGVIFYKIIATIFSQFGIKTYAGNANFTPLESLFIKFPIGLKGLLQLFYADFFGSPITSPKTVIHLVYAFLIIIIAIVVVWAFWQRSVVYKILACSIILSVVGYFFNDNVVDIWSARYLVMVPFLSAPLVYGFFLEYKKEKHVRILIAIVLLISLINVSIPISRIGLNLRYHSSNPNQVNELIGNSLIAHRDYGYGYSGYWSSNNTSYLNDLKNPIIPIICTGDIVKVYHWVIYDKLVEYPHDKAFIIIDSSNEVQGDSAPNDVVRCTSEEVVKIFGSPARVDVVGSNISIYYYDYDISTKFDTRGDASSL